VTQYKVTPESAGHEEEWARIKKSGPEFYGHELRLNGEDPFLADPFGRVQQTSPQIFGLEIGEIGEQFLLGHALAEGADELLNADSQAADRGFAGQHIGMVGDSVAPAFEH
jgi:hypothetical protein